TPRVDSTNGPGNIHQRTSHMCVTS
ncbi:hypothetical protein V3C99_000240, partial [Haemonchus contortus]